MSGTDRLLETLMAYLHVLVVRRMVEFDVEVEEQSLASAGNMFCTEVAKYGNFIIRV